MEIMIPFGYRPRKYQEAILDALDDGAKRAVWVAHRRSGKDKTAWNWLFKQAMLERSINFYFFPTYTQAKKVIWDGMDKAGFKFLDHIPQEAIAKKNDSELKIELVNGSIIQLIGSDNYNAIMGTNPKNVVFSEYALCDPMAWDYIRPILTENGGKAVFIFTPRGLNHGWKILQQAKENGWFWEVLTIKDTGAIDEETMEEERKQMPADLFQQEWMCAFLEGAGQFFKKIDEKLWDGKITIDKYKKYRVGVDLGKYQDYTVITPIDMHTWEVGRQDHFNLLDWNFQKDKIEGQVKKYNNAEMVLDSTGVGDPIFEDLVRRRLNVYGFKFTQSSRELLLKNLAVKIENGEITLPDDKELLDELRSFKYELSDNGKLKIAVPEGLHDDRVMSLALAFWDIWRKLEVRIPHIVQPGTFEWEMEQIRKYKEAKENE